MKTLIEVCKEKGYNFDARRINVSCSGLTSLEGIELFTKLEVLVCSFNKITSLDLSKNTALRICYCHNNKLMTLDLSKNTALRKLDCAFNNLTSLDLSNNPAFRELVCSDTKYKYTPIFYSLERIKIGCKENTFEFWDNFFLGNCSIKYSTKRGTPEFDELVMMWIEFKKELGL